MTARERPYVTLKVATSLDGKIATANGESRWITGPEARVAVHKLRSEHDCVLIGIGTALADDPELTVRTVPLPAIQPLRVVVDSFCRLPPDGKLASSAGAHAVVVYVSASASPAAQDALRVTGVEVRVTGASGGDVDLSEVLADLKKRGVQRLFVEGGGKIAVSLLNGGFVDRIEWMRASLVLGAGGVPAIGEIRSAALADAPRFRRLNSMMIGDDVWETYEV